MTLILNSARCYILAIIILTIITMPMNGEEVHTLEVTMDGKDLGVTIETTR